MANRIVLTVIAGLTVLLALPSATLGQVWNSPGLTAEEFKAMSSGGAAPRRDISGIWDAGAAGVNGAPQEKEREAARAPFTSTTRCRLRATPPDFRGSCCTSCGRSRWCRRRARC